MAGRHAMAPVHPEPSRERRAWTVLAVSAIGFAINCWAWALLSPLGPLFRDDGQLGSLTESDVALLVAVPVVVGSLGRVIVGSLTDSYGGRLMFPLVSALTILPVLFIGLFALDSYPLLLVGGVFLGLGGTVFAIGVPLVNGWFPPERRGLAIGVFGMGMGGTAISALTTVRLFETDERMPFLITAFALAAYAAVAWVLLRDPAGRTAPAASLWARLVTNGRRPITWQASVLYAVAFGGYVAFSVYLPSYLINAHHLEADDAAMRMAGFVIVAVLLRPVGGSLSDRIHPVPVLAGAFGAVTICAAIASATPPLHLGGTAVFLLMAGGLGLGSGACFALVSSATPSESVGGVTGIVGAAGGFGGFFPPLIMGYIYGQTNSYAIGLLLLAAAAAGALVLTLTAARRTAAREPHGGTA